MLILLPIGNDAPFAVFDYFMLEILNLSFGTESDMMMEYKRYDGISYSYGLEINEDRRIKQDQNLITYY
jgi:hypothetical protein